MENTHLYFDGKKLIISPNLHVIFNFLQGIELEINSLLGFEEKISGIRNQYLEMVGLTEVLSKIVQENNLDFDYEFKENPELIAEKFFNHTVTRSEFIVLFASIETLLCLHTAYENETDDEDQIRLLMSDPKKTKKLLNQFTLSSDNEYYASNLKRFAKVNARQIRDLRNKLTHFFSVKGLGIVHDKLSSKARTLERKAGNNVSFISSVDLCELHKCAATLLLKKWSEDYVNNNVDFMRKIIFVKNVVQKDAAILIQGDQIKI
ncbi:MAG: hypothetical protein ACI9VM_000959 [Candidatus Azotimanducaceae bacterium]|jgi:hypothetical protein